jgi:hypothetical protein
MTVNTQPGSSKLDTVKALWGQSIARYYLLMSFDFPRELLPIETTSEKLQFSMEGIISHANFNLKKGTFILFVNGNRK